MAVARGLTSLDLAADSGENGRYTLRRRPVRGV
jgi:hypothetical protein